MMGLLRRFGVIGMVAALGCGMVLGGCSKNNKQADAMSSENAELRERIASLEESNRQKDARLAELETRNSGNINGYDQGTDSGGGFVADEPRSSRGGGNFSRNSSGEMQAEIAGDVLFDSGSATIKASARKKLDSIAQEIKGRYRNADIRVEGHTDSDPIKRSKWGTNERLSQARADAVRNYLAQKGISAGRIEAVGFGSSQPKGSKAASRRVEIIIVQ